MADTPNFDPCFEGCMMRHFRIYTKDGCPHCVNAKALLKSYGFYIEELNYNPDDPNDQRIIELFFDHGWKSFPLIFEIGVLPNKQALLIGGFSDLKDYLDDEL